MCFILRTKIKFFLYKLKSVLPRILVVETMAKIQFLTILLVVTCFLGGVVSVTDREFEVRTVHN